MYPLKVSTAITVAFFAHDVSGDAVTGLVDGGFTKRISKNGAAFGAMTVTITEMENGFYSFPLSTSHSDTAGILTILFTHGSTKQINLQYRVHANLPDDLATDIATVDSNVDAVLVDTGTTLPATLSTIDTNVDAVLVDTGTTLPATLATAAALATVDTNVDAILVDTAEIGAAGAGLTALPISDANVTQINGVAAAAVGLSLSADAIENGTASGIPTGTTMISDITVTVDDQFQGRNIIFADDTMTAGLQGAATDITGCTAATDTLTFTALPATPVSGDTFIIT